MVFREDTEGKAQRHSDCFCSVFGNRDLPFSRNSRETRSSSCESSGIGIHAAALPRYTSRNARLDNDAFGLLHKRRLWPSLHGAHTNAQSDVVGISVWRWCGFLPSSDAYEFFVGPCHLGRMASWLPCHKPSPPRGFGGRALCALATARSQVASVGNGCRAVCRNADSGGIGCLDERAIRCPIDDYHFVDNRLLLMGAREEQRCRLFRRAGPLRPVDVFQGNRLRPASAVNRNRIGGVPRPAAMEDCRLPCDRGSGVRLSAVCARRPRRIQERWGLVSPRSRTEDS